MKFTCEVGGESVNFLDLCIRLSPQGFSYSIFRKPTNTDLYIDSSSYCHPRHKEAPYCSMVHRLTSIPLGEGAFKEELGKIKTLAQRNGVHLDIDGMVRRKLTAKSLSQLTSLLKPEKTSDRKKWIRLPYLGRFTTGLSRMLKGHKLRAGYYKVRTLGSILPTPKDPIPLLGKSGVYRLSCPNCSALYIGETSRAFSIRFNEHETSYRKGKRDSSFAEHLLDSNHLFNSDLCQPIHIEGNYRRRRALEDLEIYRHKEQYGSSVTNRSMNVV